MSVDFDTVAGRTSTRGAVVGAGGAGGAATVVAGAVVGAMVVGATVVAAVVGATVVVGKITIGGGIVVLDVVLPRTVVGTVVTVVGTVVTVVGTVVTVVGTVVTVVGTVVTVVGTVVTVVGTVVTVVGIVDMTVAPTTQAGSAALMVPPLATPPSIGCPVTVAVEHDAAVTLGKVQPACPASVVL